MNYVNQYLEEAIAIVRQLDQTAIERMAELLRDVRGRGGRLFVLGVGGGAGHASHAVCDFRKIAQIEAYSPSDNVSELTARVNDDGWETSYANWLRGCRLDSTDAVLVFSVGGGDAKKNVSAYQLYSRLGFVTETEFEGQYNGYPCEVARMRHYPLK